jgi:hypothetical protein
LLELNDLQCKRDGVAAATVDRSDRLEQPLQGYFLSAQVRSMSSRRSSVDGLSAMACGQPSLV